MPKAYNPNDKYFRMAQQEGYRARSVYKLIEIDQKFSVLRAARSVLDLGCAPGSWLQYLVQRCPKVIGVDIQVIEPVEGASIYQCDIFSEEIETILQDAGVGLFDVIVSDMAPKTMGIPDVDQYASVELNLRALEVVDKYLKPKGWAVFKIFRGEDFNDFWFEAKKIFPEMKTFKPHACRDRSYEMYCVGKKK